MATTVVATTAITHGKVYGSTTTAQAVLSKAHTTKATARVMSLHAQHEPNALPSQAQISYSQAPHAKQPTLVAQPVPAEQPTLVAQPTYAAQPAPVEQPTPVAQPIPAAQPAPVAFKVAQVNPRLSQPSGPNIKPGAFPPRFSVDLTFPNSNLAPEAYHTSTAQ
ncbi:non-classical arabinogalactan protein 31-like [Malus domestica]|uniref:non-classical arabinogalactan protein 31-like n=1 Tax=Malus domestica TaxID=3750 RepID=UPI0039767910